MKVLKSYMALAATALVVLASCSEGQYWTEPDNLGEVVVFAKPAVQVSVDPSETAPTSYTVTVNRSNSNGELTVPVTLTTADSDVLSGPSSVTFANGSYSADYVISIGTITPGVTYSASLAVTQPSDDTLLDPDSQNLKFSFSITQELVWTKVGTTVVTSVDWAYGDSGEVVIEEGSWPVEGERLFRLLDVYYAIEPDYAVEGTELRFFTDNDGNALRMAEDWSNIGEYSTGYGYWWFGCPAKYGCSFYNDGNNYVMYGVLGYGEDASDVTAYDYETLTFEWNCPAK